jgi:hypothetical protein
MKKEDERKASQERILMIQKQIEERVEKGLRKIRADFDRFRQSKSDMDRDSDFETLEEEEVPDL